MTKTSKKSAGSGLNAATAADDQDSAFVTVSRPHGHPGKVHQDQGVRKELFVGAADRQDVETEDRMAVLQSVQGSSSRRI